MRSKRITELKAEVRQIEVRFDEFLGSLGKFEDAQGRAFNLSADIPATDSTVSDLRARHTALAALIRKLDSKAAVNVPLSFFNSAINALRSIRNSIDQIEAEIKTVSTHGGLSEFNFTAFQATTNGGHIIDFSSQFKSLFDNSESYLISFHNLFQAINPSRAAFNFGAATSAFSNVVSTGSSISNELSVTLKKAKSELENIQKKESELAAVLSRANVDASLITEQAGRASEAIAQIEGSRDSAKEVSEFASTLQLDVVNYQAKFAIFDVELAERNDKFEQGQSKLESLTSDFVNQREFIRSIIDQSDNMLSGATVAGLSSEFKTIKDDLTNQLESAYKTFRFSIGCLFVSAIPLIVYIFAPIIALLWGSQQGVISSLAEIGTGQSGWQYIGQVLARFIILFPAVWFVTFSTSRYNSLFKLREHYAYKYSMAMAVDGFKKQAPGHEDLIAALVFEQLAFNPADKLGKKFDTSESTPNPAMQLLLELLRKRVDRDTEA